MTITGTTKVFAVVGRPVTHSLSPIMHNGWYADLGLDAVYVALPLAAEQPGDALGGIGALGLAGINVTVPFKEAAAQVASVLEPLAGRLGAANVLTAGAMGLVGANTDAPGFVASLDEAIPSWRAQVSTALVVGAGGAGRAIALGLIEAGVARVVLCNRDRVRGEQAAASLGAEFLAFEDLSSGFAVADLIVNATTLGMGGGGPAWPVEAAKPTAIVADAVYAPLETGLLAAARARGLACVDGLGMLIHQGALAFEMWFGMRPDTRVARQRLLRVLAERQG